MSYVTWKLNGVLLHELGLKGGRITYNNLAPDTFEIRHLKARWDADPLFAYGAEIRLDRVIRDENGVVPDVETCVFRGICRQQPRFVGRQADAERLDYVFTGVWDELARRPLLQNQAVVVNPEESEIPIMVPQGLVILNQDDGGTSVNLAEALRVCVDAAIDAGVNIEIGDIEGFDFAVAWDEVADLTIADAIIRLLQVAPDVVAEIDYAPETPVIHFRRRADLPLVTLPVSPIGEGEWPAYAALDNLRITARHDLVVHYVRILFRRLNSVNGTAYLAIEEQEAGIGEPTDENALVRTIQLAGSSFSSTVLSQLCKTLPLPAALGGETLDPTVVTAASDPAAFAELVKFWKRKVPILAAAGVVIKGFKNRIRKAAEVADESGAETTPELDTSLVRELTEGFITPWMRESTLNRRSQEQNYEVRIAYSINGVDQRDAEGFGINYYAGVRATNASTRTYTFTESSSFTEAEETPEGLAQSLFDAMSVLQHDGSVTIIERECSLGIRPGKRLGLTGGRPEWATMGALIQSASADLDSWRTDITFGWPRNLGPDDLVEIARSNRLKRPAESGLNRTTGLL